jgi:hypothetical protein
MLGIGTLLKRSKAGTQRAAEFDFSVFFGYCSGVIQFLIGASVSLFLLPATFVVAQEAGKPVIFKVSTQDFVKPTKWVEQKTASRMRAAQFGVPGKDGKVAGECIFFYFGPGQGGGAQANLQRWVNQFSKDPKPKHKVEDVKVGKTAVAYLYCEGTFMSGPPFGGAKVAKPNYAMVATVLGTKPGYIFVKMTGPKEVVDAEVVAFRKMIESGLK